MAGYGADFWNFNSLHRHKFLADHQSPHLVRTFVAVFDPAVPDVHWAMMLQGRLRATQAPTAPFRLVSP